jgi:hypothetical protein
MPHFGQTLAALIIWGRVAHALPLFLLRKMLSEVTSGLQQLNREAHPRDNQSRLRDIAHSRRNSIKND